MQYVKYICVFTLCFMYFSYSQSNKIKLPFRCLCGHCSDQNLESALEYRCCQEVNPVVHLLGFDGSCQQFKCITEHPDFGPMTNRAVLTTVAPLLKGKNGRGYHRQPGKSENE